MVGIQGRIFAAADEWPSDQDLASSVGILMGTQAQMQQKICSQSCRFGSEVVKDGHRRGEALGEPNEWVSQCTNQGSKHKIFTMICQI